ncbi:zinc metalloprotease [Oceaniferula spumae]|uniref:Zinc metalloprotease n=1 Tax=Oceaniferula spumae TaxID=2979115 RepID=A0AAT9FMM3_9BACT
MAIITPILVIFLVVVIFNIIIFVHELGHFLAARWRGLEVERFQIWFGKPIWKKTYNGVQYGLGWIPFGGFVALPQMVTMEAIEGDNMIDKPLPPAKPLDKIIVAFAGPLFSFLLAFATAFIVWGVGKPDTRLTQTTIGYVEKDSAAEKAGLKPGDEIVSIGSNKIDSWAGNMDTGVVESIATSEGDKIQIVVNRPGVAEPVTLNSGYKIEDTSWYKRAAMRKIGISYKEQVIVGRVLENSPAAEAGLQEDDLILTFKGQPALSRMQLIKAAEAGEPTPITVKRGSEELSMTLVPRKPMAPNDDKTAFGVGFKFDESLVSDQIVHPGPWRQIVDSALVMKKTIQLVTSSESSIGVDQLAGPVGIGKGYFDMLTSSSNGWKLALGFTVLFNINLAILNMLPFPVLDGGHITLSLLEIIAGRPVKARVLEVIQTGFVFLIFGLFLYITSKDVGAFVPGGKKEPQEMKFEPSQ